MIKLRLIASHSFLLVFILSLLNGCKPKKDTLFISLPSSHTNIAFENKLEKKAGLNILYYLYYYNGGGVATGDVNNDGLPDIYFTANSPGNNKLYINKGNFVFEDATSKAGVQGTADWCSGVTMADVNGDGWLDIYVCAVTGKFDLHGHNELFINNRNGTFSERSSEYGLALACYSGQAAFFDYDHDGDLDCYIVNQSDRPFLNIVDTSNRRKYDPHSGDILLRNDLDTDAKKFSDVSAQSGIFQSNLGYGLGLAIADLNNDGWDDIYIGNDFHENDYYYVNNGNGTFSESGSKYFGHYSRFSMGNDVADFNNDGQPDIITTDMLPPTESILKTYGSDENYDIYRFKISKNGFQPQYSKNCLQRNNGNGSSFSETGLVSGIAATDWSWCPLFEDFDNDGNKDLFITSGIVKRTTDLDYIRFISDAYFRKTGNSEELDNEAIEKMPDGASHSYLFKGDGNLTFEDKSADWGTEQYKGYFNGASYADLNNDGKLDLVVNCINSPAKIFQNNSPAANYLSLSFRGENKNSTGIGVKAYVFTKEKMQYRQLMLTRGFQSSSETRLHFGLGSSAAIDSVLVIWPDQKFQVIKNLQVNKQLILSQKEASGTFDYKVFFKSNPIMLEDVSPLANVAWKHKENDFSDFNIQYLIPHAESTRGPKIAVGDVNADGLDDFYACGAKGQPGTLMIQQTSGRFISSDTEIFNSDAGYEDVDATFFDANGDGKQDLYVVSGGNEYMGKNLFLADRLYLNNGTSHFTKQANALPAIFENKSCVTTTDIDNDGDQDIFVGNLANPGAYGLPQTSYLLLNDGKAHFVIADESIINLAKIGIVTSATFADLNNDGWKDLAVTGEWMPLKIYLNHKGKFVETDVPKSTGLWQTVYPTDLNGDGFTDILAGNWGHNTKFWAGKSGALKLYVKDFDKNGSVEQVMTYSINGEEYPFLGKDELERRLPLLKKYYLNYSEVAGKSVQYMFYNLFSDYLELTAEHLGSSCFINDGKGNFKMVDLPDQLQLAPIFAYQQINKKPALENRYLCGGNFFDVIPYEGRYDAQSLAVFGFDKNNVVTWYQQPSLSGKRGQVRDIKSVKTGKNEGVIIVAPNNDSLAFYKTNDVR